jgi:hypothetical protein
MSLFGFLDPGRRERREARREGEKAAALAAGVVSKIGDERGKAQKILIRGLRSRRAGGYFSAMGGGGDGRATIG